MNASKAGQINSIATPLIEVYGSGVAKKFEARQINRNANAIATKGTRDAAEVRRQGKIIASNARAAMGASGGVASDAGGIEDLAEIKKVTDYNALATLFESETKAGGLRTQAEALKLGAKKDYLKGAQKTIGTIMSDSDKMFGEGGIFGKSGKK